MKILFYDFEVFSHLWLVVIINYETKKKLSIINNPELLKSFYNDYKDYIWVGYNSRMYDQFILKAVLNDMSPWQMSIDIIQNDRSGYSLLQGKEDFPLNNFDISTGFHSLKQLEGFMGSVIKESSVPFDLDRPLTESEIQETLKYCTHDVEQTIEVFEKRREEFDSQFSLIEAFNLPKELFNKTKAQLSATILGAVRDVERNDEFEISIPDTLKLSEKYQYVVDWYNDKDNRSYKKKLYTNVADVPHIFAWGGIHGAISNYSYEGIILCLDVASLYPSLMIEYGYVSRNVKDSTKYKQIRDTRLKFKAEKNPMQLPYKIVLNATYGAMKDKHNQLYDPLMANNVCVAGQLLLLDLIEKIEPYCELIQSNTDGLFLKVEKESDIEVIKKVAKEWEKRTRLDLEWDLYTKIFQKDVNNYIIINKEGKYKSKGAYVKKLSSIDYDLPIVNHALVNHFIEGKSIRESIMECNDLKEFQKIVKVSSLYKYALHGETKLKEKVLRVFASKDPNEQGVFKVKTEDRVEKIANTPEHCFIYNDNVSDAKVPDILDKEYYVEISEKRLADFLNSTSSKSSMPNEIKGVNQEIKNEVVKLYETSTTNDFIEFILDITDKTKINSSQIETLIILNYFNKYGNNKYLHESYKYFKKRYSKNHKDKTKIARLEEIREYISTLENNSYGIAFQARAEVKYFGYIKSIFNIDPEFMLIKEIDITHSPIIYVYRLRDHQEFKFKIYKSHFKFNPVIVGDIIKIIEAVEKPRKKKVDDEWVELEEKEMILEKYERINV